MRRQNENQKHVDKVEWLREKDVVRKNLHEKATDPVFGGSESNKPVVVVKDTDLLASPPNMKSKTRAMKR